MNPVVIIVSILGILIGLAVCFFGERIFKISLSATGFGVGALLIGGVTYSVTNNPLIAIGAGFVGGIISWFFVQSTYRTGMFFIGFGLTAIVVTYATLAMNVVNVNIQRIEQIDQGMIQQLLPVIGVGFVAAIVTGAMFVIFDTPILKFATAIVGGMLVSIAGFVITTGTDTVPESAASLVSAQLFIFGLAWIPLAIAGLVFQFFGIDWLLRFLQIDQASRQEKARRNAYRQQQRAGTMQPPPSQPPYGSPPPQQGGYPQQPPQQGGYPQQQNQPLRKYPPRQNPPQKRN